MLRDLERIMNINEDLHCRFHCSAFRKSNFFKDFSEEIFGQKEALNMIMEIWLSLHKSL